MPHSAASDRAHNRWLQGGKPGWSAQHAHEFAGRGSTQPHDHRTVRARGEVDRNKDIGDRMSDSLVNDEEVDHPAAIGRAASWRAGCDDRASKPVQPSPSGFIAHQLLRRHIEVTTDEPRPAVPHRRVASRMEQLEVPMRDSFGVP